MTDFNFFEPYLTKKDRPKAGQLVLYIVCCVVCVVLIVFPIVNQITIKNMRDQIAAANIVMESEKFRMQSDKIDDTEKQIQKTQNYCEILKSVDDEVRKIDLINDLFFQTITDRVPEDIFFKNINISQDMIQIAGIATNNISIAEFEQNLRQAPYFRNIFISGVSAGAGGYIFTISFEIKGEIDDETDQKGKNDAQSVNMHNISLWICQFYC